MSEQPSPSDDIVFIPEDRLITREEAMEHPDYQQFTYLMFKVFHNEPIQKVIAGIKSDNGPALNAALVKKLSETISDPEELKEELWRYQEGLGPAGLRALAEWEEKDKEERDPKKIINDLLGRKGKIPPKGDIERN